MKSIKEALKDKKKLDSKIKESPKTAIKLKHTIVLKKLSENIRKGGMTQAMKDAGYSDSYARSSTHLTKGKSWNALVKEFFPSSKILAKHEELLNAKKVRAISFPKQTPEKDAIDLCIQCGFEPTSTAQFLGQLWVYCIVPNGDIQDKALDKLYKISGRYKETLTIDDTDKYRLMPDSDLAIHIQKKLNFFKKK